MPQLSAGIQKTICLLLFLLRAGVILSQDGDSAKAVISSEVLKADVMFSIHAGIPSESMKPLTRNNMFDMGFGAGILALSNPGSWGRNKRNTMLRIGAELGYTYYGRFLTVVDINGYRGDYKTSYGIAHLNAILRIRPPGTHFIHPFADVFAGGHFYFSTIKENLDAIESALGLQGFDIGGTSSASFVKGLGGGISFGSRNPERARLILRATWNRGTKLRYIERNSLVVAGNSLTYRTGRAPVDFFMVQVGIGL